MIFIWVWVISMILYFILLGADSGEIENDLMWCIALGIVPFLNSIIVLMAIGIILKHNTNIK